MWLRLSLRDFVIVSSLDVELATGFSVLTGETGAGKSILIDALQLALGSRGDAGVVREGALRAEISAEFDTPASLHDWLADAGFTPADTLLLRRTIDAQGKSRAWVNGSAATLAQLREAADHLVDIHGQHAWQSLTRGPAVRALLDAHAGLEAGVVEPRRKARRRVELGTDLGARGTFAHHQRIAAAAERELQRIDQDRLAGTGLAGQHRKAAVELDFKCGHDDEIAQGESAQHFRPRTAARRGLSAPSGGSERSELGGTSFQVTPAFQCSLRRSVE